MNLALRDVSPAMTPQVVFGATISRIIRRILLITLTVISLDTATLLSQTEAEWEWANKHFGQALDALTPLRRVAGPYVVYRAHRDLRTDVPEYWFLIGRDQNEKGYGLHTYLSAHVRAAETLSIYDQLRSMRRSNEQGDAVSITQKIKLQTWDLNETNCPAIKDEVEKLEELQPKLPKLTADTIVLHPMNWVFR